MKKLAIGIVVLMMVVGGGCVTANVRPLPEQVVRVKVDGANAEISETQKDQVQKTMSIANPELAFSRFCRIYEDTAYITVTSISSYSSEELWQDFKLLQKRGIKKAIIYLNSPGGAAFQGMSISDELRLAKGDIYLTVEGRGLIASAAIPVFLMANKRFASKNTIFLVHPSRLFKWGIFTETLADLNSQSKMITLLNNIYAETVSDCSNLSKEKILDMLKTDNWFTAQEAKEMGFVDEIR